METEVYTTPCGMFRVLKKDGLYFPQERTVTCNGFGRMHTQAEVNQFEMHNAASMHYGPWESFFLGRRQFNAESKGYKSYRTLPPAIAYVDRLSENLQEG